MAWLGASIVVVTSLRYMLFSPAAGGAYQELFAVSAEAPPPTMVQAIPSAHLALLLMVQCFSSSDALHAAVQLAWA
jgi:hypothetical protein